ncbi:MAG: DUF456 family protein [Anaerolineae bacterium]|nr:DUF456 family protein [Anaerolineae bacterium]NUQ02302.1 DUF456 domain-containing protein [Anaerolineae bacterium]
MDFAQSALTLFTLIAMVVTFFVALIPFIPGPTILWAISLLYAILTGFQEVTWVSMILISLLALLALTSSFWLPLLGMNGSDMSCSSAVGTLVGGLAGTFLIPIPILGTLLGAIGGAVVLEVIRARSMNTAVKAGVFALDTYLKGMFIEAGINLAIIGIFYASIIV